MRKTIYGLSIVFAAGSAGGLSNSIAVWIFGIFGITEALSVNIAPPLTPSWLYPRIVWGGIWGILFLLPIAIRSYPLKGLIYSLGPTIVQLFIVFPLKANKGMMGFELGILTPLFVLIFNAIWGIQASIIIKSIEDYKNAA
jgi:hypothetical protein